MDDCAEGLAKVHGVDYVADDDLSFRWNAEGSF